MWGSALESEANPWAASLHLPSPNNFIPSEFGLRYPGPRQELLDTEDRQVPQLVERTVFIAHNAYDEADISLVGTDAENSDSSATTAAAEADVPTGEVEAEEPASDALSGENKHHYSLYIILNN